MPQSTGSVYALIMAGGVGSRFWPLSRRDRPKQFLRFFGDRTLIQRASDRLDGLIPPERRFVVTNENYVAETARQLPRIPPENILAEPIARNTAPCIAFGARRIEEFDPEGVMLVLPADHLIQDVDGFHQAVSTAVGAAGEKGVLVTMGIRPSFPSTGFGYIEFDKGHVAGDGPGGLAEAAERAYDVVSFTEKPDADTAEEFLSSGRYLWNSGMFAWRVDSIMEEFGRSLPGVFDAFRAVSTADDDFGALVKSAFERSPNISIDYGVMEKARKVTVVPCDIGWNDVGDWKAAYDLSPKDERGNATDGDTLLVDADNCYAYGSARRVVLLGTRDLVVVDAGDSVLVCDREHAQKVKEAANEAEGKSGVSR